jgi:hypothetical protein
VKFPDTYFKHRKNHAPIAMKQSSGASSEEVIVEGNLPYVAVSMEVLGGVEKKGTDYQSVAQRRPKFRVGRPAER